MSLVYVVLINVILIFIVYVVLNHKINKHSTSALLDRYAREVESLIVELNRSIDDVLNLSEERVGELKKLLRKAEKLLNDPVAKKSLAAGDETPGTGNTVSAGTRRRGAALYDERGRRSAPSPAPDAPHAVKAPAGGNSAAGGDSQRTLNGEPAGTGPTVREDASYSPGGESLRVNMVERTRHLLSMGHSKEEIAGILRISRAEMDFLVSLQNK